MGVDLRHSDLDGKAAEDRLHAVGITVNRNSIPYDTASKFNPSGIRLGSPSVTTRGMGVGEMAEIADCVADLLEALAGDRGEAELDAIRERTLTLTNRFPLPYALS